MNYNVYKFQELDNGYYFFFLSLFSEKHVGCASEQIEHYISNEPTQMNQYLHSIDFDNVKVEIVHINPIDVINNNFPPDEKNMLISSSYISLIPPPNAKRTPKPKADKPVKEKKEPKAKKGVKTVQKVQISTEPQVLKMD